MGFRKTETARSCFRVCDFSLDLSSDRHRWIDRLRSGSVGHHHTDSTPICWAIEPAMVKQELQQGNANEQPDIQMQRTRQQLENSVQLIAHVRLFDLAPKEAPARWGTIYFRRSRPQSGETISHRGEVHHGLALSLCRGRDDLG